MQSTTFRTVWVVIDDENWDILRVYRRESQARLDACGRVDAQPEYKGHIGIRKYENGRPVGEMIYVP